MSSKVFNISGGGSGSSGGGGIALGGVTNLKTVVASGAVYFKWTDPEDIVVAGATLATWKGTLLVRKVGSYPVNRRDGEVVGDFTERNQHQSAYFGNSGLTNGQTYYYKFFPYTTTGTYTDDKASQVALTPTTRPVGAPTGLKAVKAGNGKVDLNWTDAAETVSEEGIVQATWGKTVVVLKAGSKPTGPDDEGDFRQEITTRNAHVATPLTATGLTNGTTYNVAIYSVTTEGVASAALEGTVVPNRIEITTVPVQEGTLTYNGIAQSPKFSNYDTTKMVISFVAQINAGDYTATATPLDDYCWSNGDTSGKTIAWKIGKAAGGFTLSVNNVTLNSSAKSVTVVVNRTGDGVVSANSSAGNIATATVNGTNVVIASVNDTTGNATVTVSVAEGTNWTKPADQTITVKAEFLPAIGTKLENVSWADIKRIADADLGTNYFTVGDRKSITINGTVGTKSYSSVKTWVYILGFNHNASLEGQHLIHFGGFKTAETGGIDIALDADDYNTTPTSGTKSFMMNHWWDSTNYGSNFGGWKGCDMRYDILGSTNRQPSQYGSIKTNANVGYDPSGYNPATAPVTGSLMAALPADLRAVIQPITKYTDNVGNSSNTAANVTATIDYLPLLAEFEVHGARTYANDNEKSKQAQYAYYAASNSKIKYRQSATGTALYWWNRSPNYNNATNFCLVANSGNAYNSNANRSFGVAPLFAV